MSQEGSKDHQKRSRGSPTFLTPTKPCKKRSPLIALQACVSGNGRGTRHA